jgi:ribonuclease III
VSAAQPLPEPWRRLEGRLGHIFQTPGLFQQALTHRSHSSPHNERLEFLGDALLNCVVAELLYQQFQRFPEGDLSRLRAALVNQAALAEIALSFDLGALLRLGEGELKSGGFRRPSILADALEALFGAIYLDAGFDAVRGVISGLYAERLAGLHQTVPGKDAKTSLQEVLQAKRLETPRYRVLTISGEAHQQLFRVACDVAALGLHAEGEGASRKAAEQDAAAKVRAMIND